MKKLTILIAGFFLLLSTAFATPTVNVSKIIRTNFEKDFVSCSDVTWSKTEEVYVASFKNCDRNMAAVYNEEGQLLSVGRAVTFDQLPLSVSLAVQEKYSGYTINNSVIELFAGGTTYFINAESDKHILRIQADSAGNATTLSKTKKK